MDNLLLIGRYEEEKKGISFSWPGFTVSGKFFGTHLNIDVDSDRCFLNIDIDGVVSRLEITPDNKNYVLADNLHESLHSFKITLIHEVKSKFYLKSVNTDGAIKPREPNPLKIEFIGDSLTVGYGNMSPGLNWDRDDAYVYYTDNTKGYAALTGKHFDADVMITAYSGKGMMLNYANDEPGITVPYYYDSIHPFKKSSKWDHSKYNPDITVINLGTNDFSNDVDVVEWEQVYSKFIQKVKSVNKGTKMILISPGEIAYETIKKMAKENDCGFYSYKVPYSSLDTHPNMDEHKKMAEGLISVVEELVK